MLSCFLDSYSVTLCSLDSSDVSSDAMVDIILVKDPKRLSRICSEVHQHGSPNILFVYLKDGGVLFGSHCQEQQIGIVRGEFKEEKDSKCVSKLCRMSVDSQIYW
jgi:hypothetical protein